MLFKFWFCFHNKIEPEMAKNSSTGLEKNIWRNTTNKKKTIILEDTLFTYKLAF